MEAAIATATERRTLPWSWYTDPEQARTERDRIFRRAWQYTARADQVPVPGSYAAASASGFPVVITRDKDDTLRAFANVCRHRGALVATGEAQRGTLQCPYHAWTYGLDGCLRAAPRAAQNPGLELGELGLRELAVGTWGPFIFVNPDPHAGPLEQALGDLPAVVAEHGLDVDGLVFDQRWEYEIRANWKIAVENYLECYHCQLNHPDLVTVIDDRALSWETAGLRASQFNPAEVDALAGKAAISVPGGEPSAQFHLLFPSLKFNVMPGPPNLSIGPIWPVAPDRCRGYLDYWFAPGTDPAWIDELYELDTQVGQEDTGLVEAVQAGAASGLVEDGTLLSRDEQLIAYFQDYVRERLREPA